MQKVENESYQNFITASYWVRIIWKAFWATTPTNHVAYTASKWEYFIDMDAFHMQKADQVMTIIYAGKSLCKNANHISFHWPQFLNEVNMGWILNLKKILAI